MYRLVEKCFSPYPLRAWFAALSAGTIGVALAGLQLQALLSLAPCPYCIFQRLLYLLIGAVALLGFLFPSLALLWLAVIGSMALLGLGVALYQSWMQAYPNLAPECGFSNPDLIERLVDVLGMQWPGLFLATGFCSSKEWVFLGLSMANWSLLFFIGVIIFAFGLAKHPGR